MLTIRPVVVSFSKTTTKTLTKKGHIVVWCFSEYKVNVFHYLNIILMCAHQEYFVLESRVRQIVFLNILYFNEICIKMRKKQRPGCLFAIEEYDLQLTATHSVRVCVRCVRMV